MHVQKKNFLIIFSIYFKFFFLIRSLKKVNCMLKFALNMQQGFTIELKYSKIFLGKITLFDYIGSVTVKTNGVKLELC